MYLWVIIATFIAALFAMNVSLRSDIQQLYVEPQAQTVITKIYVQHKAAMQYISNRNRNSTVEGMSYRPGELTTDMMAADLPYGFNQDSGFSRFTTWVYCLDKDKLDQSGAAALPASCTAGLPADGSDPDTGDADTGDGSNCCAGSDATVYLVTYGCVPAKWRDFRTGKPDAVLLRSMKTTTGYTDGFGYAVDRDELKALYSGNSVYEEGITTNMGVYGQGNRYYTPIPNYISDTPIGDRSFATVCGTQRQGNADYDPSNPQSVEDMYASCDYCLVYLSQF